MLEKAIVINSYADFPIAELVANREKSAIYTPKSIGNQKVKEVILAGADRGNIKAEKFIDLGGTDRGETAQNLYKYYKGLK
ncbi:hypothetical protein [Alkalihalobacillus sp. AL-G]|uniref:hypothetical protein n=1 Tax=Alkalihalobacillus sp. AL-G TaxID=2926399 RepID=UPI00272D12E2|nr:hypothetical protein [Alkalihalobacillus sp. AL-G]WLD92711.1 hypothetical protein MOJ78_17120 [Alkalihalobacillus sp. AL-G]